MTEQLETKVEKILQLSELKCSESSCKCNNGSFRLRHCPCKSRHNNNDENPSLEIKVHNTGVYIEMNCWSQRCSYKTINTYITNWLQNAPSAIAPVVTEQATQEDEVNGEVVESRESRDYVEEYLAERDLSDEVRSAFNLQSYSGYFNQPYKNNSGETVAIKRRYPNGDKKFRKGDKNSYPYGIQAWSKYPIMPKKLNIVEGESDTHALFTESIIVKPSEVGGIGATLGSGGSPHDLTKWPEYIWEKFESIIIWIDNGHKGYSNLDNGAKSLIESSQGLPADVVAKIKLGILPAPYKDISEWRLSKDTSSIKDIKYLKYSEYVEDERLAAIGSLLESTDVLAEFTAVATSMKILPAQAKLLFLQGVSAGTDRPLSIILSGDSATGKSFLATKIRDNFFVEDLYIRLDSMSEMALVYDPRSYKHKILWKMESNAKESDSFIELENNLLSENEIVHNVVNKNKLDSETEALIVRRKEGPCGLISTTTNTSMVHDKNTRVIMLLMPNDRQSIMDTSRAIVDTQFLMPSGPNKPADFSEWKALTEYLHHKKYKVHIPYGQALNECWDKVAPEQNRDLSQLGTLIKTVTLLNFKHREIITDNEGSEWVVATLDDYETIRPEAELIFASSIGKTIPAGKKDTLDLIHELSKKEFDTYFSVVDILAAGTNAEGREYKHRSAVSKDVAYLLNKFVIEQDPNRNKSSGYYVRTTKATRIDDLSRVKILPTLIDIQARLNSDESGELIITDSDELKKYYDEVTAEAIEQEQLKHKEN